MALEFPEAGGWGGGEALLSTQSRKERRSLAGSPRPAQEAGLWVCMRDLPGRQAWSPLARGEGLEDPGWAGDSGQGSRPRPRKPGADPLPFADGKLYDAYVSYSDSPEDRKFVNFILKPQLERRRGYKLFLDDRDLLPRAGTAGPASWPRRVPIPSPPSRGPARSPSGPAPL